MYGRNQSDAEGRSRDSILVVADDSSLRKHAVTVLSDAGIKVHWAGSGEDALDTLAHRDVDAVLLDTRLPGMDGFDACRRIRELRRGEFLPVILAVGLDEISVESGTEGVESSALLVGKYLNPDLYVGYSQGLFNPEGAVLLRLRLTERLDVESRSGVEQSVDLFYRIEYD